MTQKPELVLLGFHFTATRVGEQGKLPGDQGGWGRSLHGMRASRAVQEILFLKEPESCEAVAGGVEAPASSAGSLQTEDVQQRWCLGRAG